MNESTMVFFCILPFLKYYMCNNEFHIKALYFLKSIKVVFINGQNFEVQCCIKYIGWLHHPVSMGNYHIGHIDDTNIFKSGMVCLALLRSWLKMKMITLWRHGILLIYTSIREIYSPYICICFVFVKCELINKLWPVICSWIW